MNNFHQHPSASTSEVEVELHRNVCYSSVRNNNDEEEVQLHQNVCYSSPRAIDKEVNNACHSTHTSSRADKYENHFLIFLLTFSMQIRK